MPSIYLPSVSCTSFCIPISWLPVWLSWVYILRALDKSRKYCFLCLSFEKKISWEISCIQWSGLNAFTARAQVQSIVKEPRSCSQSPAWPKWKSKFLAKNSCYSWEFSSFDQFLKPRPRGWNLYQKRVLMLVKHLKALNQSKAWLFFSH